MIKTIMNWSKDFLPKTLYWRSLFILVTPFLIVQAVSSYVFFERHWDAITRNSADMIAGNVAAALEIYDRKYFRHFDDFRNFSLAKLHAQVAKVKKSPIQKESLKHNDHLESALSFYVTKPYIAHITPEDVLIEVEMAQENLIFSLSRRHLYSKTTSIYVGWSIGSMILFLGIALFFMRGQIGPIRKLAEAAEAFGRGQELSHFRIEGALEVRQAAAAFNIMRERIKRQIAQRTEMLAGVSHDLRTPLTRMRLQLEVAPHFEGKDYLIDDIGEMEKMLKDYIAFTKGEGEEVTKQVDISNLIDGIVDDFSRLPNQEIRFDVKCLEGITLSGRRNALKRALVNVISNAARYGRLVKIDVLENKTTISVLIEDDGVGIPAEERENVFRPFYRVDPSRNAQTGGTGLGLSIARDIIHAHGGEVSLSDSSLPSWQGGEGRKGLKVMILLPK